MSHSEQAWVFFVTRSVWQHFRHSRCITSTAVVSIYKERKKKNTFPNRKSQNQVKHQGGRRGTDRQMEGQTDGRQKKDKDRTKQEPGLCSSALCHHFIPQWHRGAALQPRERRGRGLFFIWVRPAASFFFSCTSSSLESERASSWRPWLLLTLSGADTQTAAVFENLLTWSQQRPPHKQRERRQTDWGWGGTCELSFCQTLPRPNEQTDGGSGFVGVACASSVWCCRPLSEIVFFKVLSKGIQPKNKEVLSELKLCDHFSDTV